MNLATWQERGEDAAWKTSIIEQLRVESPVRAERLASEDMNGFRLRPEEAAGSAHHRPLPTAYQDAVSLGQRILRELQGS